MKSFNLPFHVLPAILCVLLVSSCETPTAAPPPTTTLSTNLPVIAALPGPNGQDNAAQEKGGVEITVVPATYAAVQKTHVTLQPTNPGMGAAILVGLTGGMGSKNGIFVEEDTTPYLVPEPRRLTFTVRINNKLPRVFRGQGAVVQFNVAGKLVPFDKVNYTEFLNGIVPPQNENEFAIYGPLLDSLPQKGTIGISLYDVVTAKDAAGNVTERQNYEWFFSYTMQPVTQQGVAKKVLETMDPMTYQQRLMAIQQAEIQDQIAAGQQPTVPPPQ